MSTLDREPPATMELLWTIDGAAKHVRDKTDSVEWRPLSVVGPFGYKVRLQANFNRGDDKDHLGLYVGTVPGPFDAALQWPFPYEFTVTLLDCAQDGPAAHDSGTMTKAEVAAAAGTPGSTYFNRGSTAAWGWKFISHADLLANCGYTADDKIRVRVKFTQ